MFDIGFWELALIGVLALIVLGPKRLPEAARTAGKWVGKLRAFIANVQQDIDRQIDSGEIEELRRLKDELNQARNLIEESSNSVYKGIGQLADGEGVSNSIGLPGRKKSSRKAATRKKVSKKSTGGKKTVRKKARKAAKKKAAKRGSRKG